jgi:Gas vesicle protein
MIAGTEVQPGAEAAQVYGSGFGSGRDPANLGDILERVLDKGLVVAGDIQVNLLDIELLTIKLRLVIASLETAREVGIDWWENDPWLNTSAARRSVVGHELEEENQQLRARVKELESGQETGANSRSGRGSRGTSRRMGLCRHRMPCRDTPEPAQGCWRRTGPNGRGWWADRSGRGCQAGGVWRTGAATQP